MKKTLLFSLSLLVINTLAAQMNLSLGPRAGFGHSWISNSPDDSKIIYHPAGNFGASLVYSSQTNFGAGVDLIYSIEGVKAEQDMGAGIVTMENRLNYLRIPVYGIYFFGQNGDKVRPKVSLGPSFGFLLGAKNFINDNDGNDVKDSFKGFDLGLQLSGGVHVNLVENTWLVADAGYYHGLTKIHESGLADKHMNRNIQVNLGVLFGIGRY